MENVVNNARKAFLVVEMDQRALNAAHPQFSGTFVEEAVVRDMQGYVIFLEAMSDINDRAIHWLQLKDEYLEKMTEPGFRGSPGIRTPDPRPSAE